MRLVSNDESRDSNEALRALLEDMEERLIQNTEFKVALRHIDIPENEKELIKKVREEIQSIKNEIVEIVKCFLNQKFEFDNRNLGWYLDISDKAIKKLLRCANNIQDSVKKFEEWYAFWKKRNWKDTNRKEKENNGEKLE